MGILNNGALYEYPPAYPNAGYAGMLGKQPPMWAQLLGDAGAGLLQYAVHPGAGINEALLGAVQGIRTGQDRRQQLGRQAWQDQMTQQQFDLSQSEAQARIEERKAEQARRDRIRSLLTGGPAVPIGEGGPAGGQFTTQSGGLGAAVGLPPELTAALAETGDPGTFATLITQKRAQDVEGERWNKKFDWEKEQARISNDLQMRGLNQSAANAAASRQIELMKLASDQTKAGTEATDKIKEQSLKNANVLRDEYNALTKNYRTVQDAYNKIIGASKSGTGAGDMAMLYAFMKLNDPESVVRESEFAAAASTGSLGERMQGLVLRVLNGERMPESVRAELTNEAKNMFGAQQKSYGVIKERYKGLSERANVNPEDVVVEYSTPGELPKTLEELQKLSDDEVLKGLGIK